MKKLLKMFLGVAISAIFIASSANSAFAVFTAGEYDTEDYTVYVKNNLTINDGILHLQNGNAVVENEAKGIFKNLLISYDNKVKVSQGKLLYAKKAPEYDSGNDTIKARIDEKAFLARGPYSGCYYGEVPEYNLNLKAFPTLPDKGKLPEGKTVNITESGKYTSFRVTSSSKTNVTITTVSADQTIEIRTTTLSIAKQINIAGPGKVVFYVDQVTTSCEAAVNADGDSQKVLIYLSGTKDSSFKDCKGNFNIYMAGTSASRKITFESGTLKNHSINGNVYTTGTLNIQKGFVINGFVYSKSDVTIAGDSYINGKLVCQNLTVGNKGIVNDSGKIAEAPILYGLKEGIASKIIQKDLYHVTTSASEGGTITPYNTDLEEGTVINVVATPAAGYQFLRFEGDQPDSNGNITVDGNITVKAIFAKIILPTGYVNGILGEYFDSYQTSNETALRVKRIDSQIAFNFNYEAPLGTESQIEAETFSEKWTGFIKVPVTGDYTFKTLSDDGVTLSINGTEIIHRWDYISMDYTIGAPIHLEAGQLYPFKLEHQQMPLYAAAFLFWEAEGVPMGIVPSSAFYVTQETYDSYVTPVFVNELSRTGTGLTKKFFDGAEGLNGSVDYEEIGGAVNYEWQASSPDDSVLGDTFSAIMEGAIEGKFTEKMTLEFIIDDGLRVWIDNQKIIDSWQGNSDAIVEGSFDMVVGQKHKIKIEYNDLGGGATCIMRWKSDSQELEVVPVQYLYTE